jgi:hypothetical protein
MAQRFVADLALRRTPKATCSSRVEVCRRAGQPPDAPIITAATPPMAPFSAAANTSSVEEWIQKLSPPLALENRPLKRKRAPSAFCSMSTRNTSRTRPGRDNDIEFLPSHSVSIAASSVLALNERNTFSPPSSQASTTRRANSPSRDNITVLASASPPTITEPSSGLKTRPPQRLTEVIARLEAGLDRGWIPGRLRDTITEDQDFGYQRIEPHAWDESAASTLTDPDPEESYMLRKVKEIWLNARVCQSRGRDENAWCMDVVQLLVKLAIRLEGHKKLWLQSVWVALRFFNSLHC